MQTGPNAVGLQKPIFSQNQCLKTLWKIARDALKISKDNRASKERLSKVLGIAWQGTQKDDCDDPTKKENLK